MVKVQVTHEGKGITAVIEGVVDDQADLEKEIGPVPASLRVNCGKIKRFNSIGVKNWITYFEGLRKREVMLEFIELSPAVVEMCNSYRNFLPGAKLFSLQVPFNCGSCKTSFVQTRTIEQLKNAKFSIERQLCPKCGAGAEFDDLPDAYFGFLLD